MTGYTFYGDYGVANPPAQIVDAVANGDIDIAAAWGPLAGYFAKRSGIPMTVTPIENTEEFAARNAGVGRTAAGDRDLGSGQLHQQHKRRARQ